MLVVRQGYHETMSKLFGLTSVYFMLLECQALELKSPSLHWKLMQLRSCGHIITCISVVFGSHCHTTTVKPHQVS